MIKLKYLPNKTHSNFKFIHFDDLDSFLLWYFNDKQKDIEKVVFLAGHDIITGEIKQRGINNN